MTRPSRARPGRDVLLRRLDEAFAAAPPSRDMTQRLIDQTARYAREGDREAARLLREYADRIRAAGLHFPDDLPEEA